MIAYALDPETTSHKEQLAARAHLESCGVCAAEFALARKIDAPPVATESAAVERLTRQLENAHLIAAPRRPDVARLAWVLPLAASLLLAIIALPRWIGQAEPPALPDRPAESSLRGAGLETLEPQGDLTAAPHLLRWSVWEGASAAEEVRYRAVVSRPSALAFWQCSTTDLHCRLPDSAAGFPLIEGVRYSWHVEVLDREGSVLLTSEPTDFHWSSESNGAPP